ncbi:Thermolabile hemolysin [Tolypocladium capitatum]|uniref:Thermolabile hemolysin n=1 Tax=Tolypocladium capitatum TaxID=45235 RepID=A0A2K3QCD4_9HYPO|nr:Thermolabile hemolysin [Tolypocladium capitatum]
MLSIIAVGAVMVAQGAAQVAKMQNLVTFGDSYTDEGRFDYFSNHGKPPPTGAMLPADNDTYSGGFAWGRLVANTVGAAYYDYAVGGAMCSNTVVNRTYPFTTNGLFPSVMEYEIPTFQTDLETASLYPNRQPNNTVYALWIGTNDLGIDGLLGDMQSPGQTITSFVNCVWSFFDQIYNTGGRQFVLLNELPLQFAPMYAAPATGGFNDRYWRDPAAYDLSEFQNKMIEYTTSVNTLFYYGAAFNLRVQSRWPGATFSIFDVHSMLMDVLANPGAYLDAPANVTVPYRACVHNQPCVVSPNPLTSFLWFDELHPSARMEEVIAKNFIDVVNGNSQYGTTYSSM